MSRHHGTPFLAKPYRRFESLLLRQLHPREYSLSRCDASKIATLCGAFVPNLCTAAAVTTAVGALCRPFFSRPVDYGIWYGSLTAHGIRASAARTPPVP